MMIELKKLNQESIFVNPDIIRYLESTPDSIITFIDGSKIIVADKPEEIIAKIKYFKKSCLEVSVK